MFYLGGSAQIRGGTGGRAGAVVGQAANGGGPELNAGIVVVGGVGGGNVRSLVELMAETQTAGVSVEEGRLLAMEAISRLGPEQLEALLEGEIDSPDFFRMFRFELRFAASRLAELAPERAVALWLKHTSNAFLADMLLAPWATRDSKAFASWLVGLPGDLQSGLGRTVAKLAQQKPEEFAALATQLVNSPTGVSGAIAAMTGMLEKAGKDGDPAGALAYAKALPEGALRNRALAALAKWPGLDLARQPEIAAAVAGLPSDAARVLGRELEGSAEKLPVGVARESAFVGSLKTQADKDPAAAAQRLESLAGTGDYPAAVLGFVTATAGKDPAAAAEWAFSIGRESPQQRGAALEATATAWFSANPEEARAWVEKAPLSESEYFQLTGRVRAR